MTIDGKRRMPDVIDQVARNDIQSLRGEFHDFSVIQRQQGEVLTEIRSDLKNNKPTGMKELMGSVVLISVMMAGLIAGISYVSSALSEPRLMLLEYKVEQANRNHAWKTDVLK